MSDDLYEEALDAIRYIFEDEDTSIDDRIGELQGVKDEICIYLESLANDKKGTEGE